jgi:hypothetical protein
MIIENVDKATLNHEVVALYCHAFSIFNHLDPNYL